jgi:hypothetical protein
MSLEYYSKLLPDTLVPVGDTMLRAGDIFEDLARFLAIVDNETLPASQKLDQIKAEFTLYRSVGSDGRGRYSSRAIKPRLLQARTGRAYSHALPVDHIIGGPHCSAVVRANFSAGSPSPASGSSPTIPGKRSRRARP